MSILNSAKQDATNCLEKALEEINTPLGKGGWGDFATSFERPPNLELGDLALPCFALAKVSKTAPAKIALELANKIKPQGLIVKVVAVGPYLNFFFDQARFSAKLVAEIIKAPDEYGSSQAAHQKIILEYASPNTLKEIHVGHIRNFATGLALHNLLAAVGNIVIPVNYINDSGAHIAKILWAYRKFHQAETLPANKSKFFGSVYTQAVKYLEDQPEAKSEIEEVQRLLAIPDAAWHQIWTQTRTWSLEEMQNIFDEFGLKFERVYFSSQFDLPGKIIAQELVARGIAKPSQGAVIVDLENQKLGVLVILKSDGSPLYATEDLALAQAKFKEFEPNTSLHVVDSRQSFYFQQLFATLKLMGLNQAMVHIPYDFVTLPEGSMSSRKGNIITYEDFRDEIIYHAKGETESRHPDWSPDKIKHTAWLIAEGAMKFGMLKQDVDKPITFDIKEAMSFEGYTAPYIQYAHARLGSILALANNNYEAEAVPENTVAMYQALREAAEFKDVILKSSLTYRPNLLAEYLFHLAQNVNSFYRDVPILKSADRAFRLQVSLALATVLKNGLKLLGITAPGEM